MRGGEFDVSTVWCLRAGRAHSFGRCHRIPRTGEKGDWHVDHAQVLRGVVAYRAGQAGVPGPIVISESSQHSDQSLSVNEVEPERTHSPRVEPTLGRTGQYVAQPIEHWPEVTHQVCSHPSGTRAQDTGKGVKQGFEASSRDAGDGEDAGDPPLLAQSALKRYVDAGRPADDHRSIDAVGVHHREKIIGVVRDGDPRLVGWAV